MMWRFFARAHWLVTLLVLSTPASASAPEEGSTLCEAAQQARLADYAQSVGAQVESDPVVSRGPFTIAVERLAWKDTSEARLRVVYSAQGLAQFQVEVFRASTPDWAEAYTAACVRVSRRQLQHDNSGQWQALTIETPAGTLSRPYNPVVPETTFAKQPLGPIVGHIDSGVDYRRAEFQSHFLADAEGSWLARDAWDGDDQPFDLEIGQSPFFPREHGSRVLDVLLQHTKQVSVIPLRYPRPQMQTLGSHVRWLIDAGATLIMLPMGSFRSEDWLALEPVIASSPEVVFVVSAGNNGVDLGLRPVYPAVFTWPNLLTVTSVLPDGRVAPGSNFGEAVAVGVAAEELTARGIDGVSASVSGSSFAVPIVTAWLAKLQACQPALKGQSLINALLTSRRQSPDGLIQGWMDREDPPSCR